MTVSLTRGTHLTLAAILLAGTMSLANLASAPIHAQEAAGIILEIANGERVLEFSLADLDAMEQRHASFETMWGLGGDWQGVALKDLLEEAGMLDAAAVRVSALDDYAVDIALAEIMAEDPILAARVDDAPLEADNMGPLILIWPSQAAAAFDGTQSLAYWVWSVSHIEIAPQ